MRRGAISPRYLQAPSNFKSEEDLNGSPIKKPSNMPCHAFQSRDVKECRAHAFRANPHRRIASPSIVWRLPSLRARLEDSGGLEPAHHFTVRDVFVFSGLSSLSSWLVTMLHNGSRASERQRDKQCNKLYKTNFGLLASAERSKAQRALSMRGLCFFGDFIQHLPLL